ncbi:MAG: hypothetical protein NTW03_06070, partial [Verrucomicrobia bacterium]|nr:hypothetical protein [Verrucomicrobiota bacterium]
VYRNPVAADLTVELGERLTPPAPDSADYLFPQPVTVLGSSFVHRHIEAASGHLQLYATRTTGSANDSLVHWLEAGVVGIQWPMDYVRYAQVWPSDVAKYSHYVRPLVATEAEAKETAVALSFQNTPVIDYQDPLDQPRAKITEESKFYTFLTPAYPAHRTLLRYTSGEYVGFERIFSWLDASLRNTNLTDPVALGLSEVADYVNFPAKYATYTNQLAIYSTYTNWLAQYIAYSNLTTFATDFSAPDNRGALYGTAILSNASLHLTEAAASQNGSYNINWLTNYPVTNFDASFTVRMSDYSTRPGDGFSFVFGTLPDSAWTTYQASEGITSGLSVCWDTYDNAFGDYAPGISIKSNGIQIVAVAMAGPTGSDPNTGEPGLLPVATDPATGQPMQIVPGSAFVPVRIVLTNNGCMDVYYRNVKVLTNIATGYTPRFGRFGLAAFTGASWETHWMDDLSITVNSGFPPYDPSAAPPYASDPGQAPSCNSNVWANDFVSPRVVRQTVAVGQRLAPPDGEAGSVGGYLAGHINAAMGQLYHAGAYVDPLASGFTAANAGAIIPVNAVPGTNSLEVWWFRANNAAN